MENPSQDLKNFEDYAKKPKWVLQQHETVIAAGTGDGLRRMQGVSLAAERQYRQ